MRNILRIIVLAFLLEFAHGAHQAHTEPEYIPSDPRRYTKPRRRLEPTANVADVINQEISKGVKHPRFTLVGVLDSTVQQSGLKRSFTRSSDTPESFEVDVVLTDPSVTEATSLSMGGGESKPANSITKFLVADHQAVDSNDFAILAVDEESGTVKGIVQKGNQLVKWVQYPGGVAFVSDASFDPPQDWTCTVVEEAGNEDTRRHLQENEQGHHNNSHHGHKHDHDHFNLASIENFAAQLGIEKMNLQSRRRVYATDTFPNEYSYQVVFFIEVDTDMVAAHDPSDAVNMPNTVDYINALITAISTIYEREIDTHCKYSSRAARCFLDTEPHLLF